MKSPAFQFYPDDFVGGKVGMMTPEEVGVYVLLLCLDWNQGGFVEDHERLARWCRTTPKRFAAVWPVLRENFMDCGGRFYNPRLEQERQKQEQWRQKSSEGGKKGADKRWHPDDNGNGGGHKGGHPAPVAVDTPPPIPNHDIPFPSPSPKDQKHLRALKRTAPKYPCFTAEMCDRLYASWSALGRPDYPSFRRTLAPLFPEKPPYTLEQVAAAIGAYVDDAKSADKTQFASPRGFVASVQHWIDQTTPIAQRDPARAYALGIIA